MTDRLTKKGLILAIEFLIMAALVVAIVWRLFFYHSASQPPSTGSPVPVSVAQAVNFPVYYPDRQRLPAAYTLDNSSFRQAQPGVVIYSIKSPGSQSLTVSEEEQPAGSVITDFIKNYIPLHDSVSTSFGEAQVGAYGKAPNLQTVASLPIKNGPWLIITASSDIKQTDLTQILQSLRR